MNRLPQIPPELIKTYQEEIAKSSSPATAKRKSISLNRFFDWAESEGHIPENPLAQPATSGAFVTTPSKGRKIAVKTWSTIGITGGLVILIFLLLGKLKLPIPFITTPAQESTIQTITNNQTTTSPGSIPANGAVIGAWNLFAKLKLSSINGTPQVGTQTLSFKLYNTKAGGTALYTSAPQSVTTDSTGSTLISLDKVPTDLFFQNNELYLEPVINNQIITDRVPVETANTAANLGGYFPANPETGAGPQTVPVLDSTGALRLAGESPAVKAESGNLLVEGQTVTLKTVDGGSGNIEINPDGQGIAHFLFEGSGENFLNVQAPNMATGSLVYGVVPNNSIGHNYNLLKLQSGSPARTQFNVDGWGNTFIRGYTLTYGDVDIENKGNLQIAGVTRLNYLGRLSSITGYYQDSGLFEIAQGTPDYAYIHKILTTATGPASNDVLTVSLDESALTTGSNRDTLVLERLGGTNGLALLVDTGNAQFNGQLRLGRYTSNPVAIGNASLIYNTTDNQIYFYNGTSWVSLGTATTAPFSSITSGTNTQAAMIVGSGASLTYTGTGTINASSLEGKTWEVTGTIGSTTPNSGVFTSLRDTGLTASKVVFTDGTSSLTSTGTVGADQGGTGFSSYTIGDLLYANTATSLNKLNDVAVGNALISSGVGVAPSWGKIVLGTHTTGNYVSSATGTTNQITVSPTTGDVVISVPSDFRAPGTVNAVSGLYTGATAGTQRITATGNLTNIGTTQFNTVTYTWPGADGSGGQVLSTSGTGTLSWTSALTASSVYWTQDAVNGVLYPKNNTVDVLIGSSATTSAKFAFMNVNSANAPTASIAGSTANVATYLTGNGNLATTNMATLSIGGSTTGNITLSPSNDIAGGFIAPNVANVTDLGLASKVWRNIYGTTIYQGANQVCDTSGNCNAVGNFWQLNNKVLSPANSTYDLTIGGTATGSAFQVFGLEKAADATSRIAKINSTLITTGTLFEATSSAITSGNIIKLGQGGDTPFTGNGLFMDFDNTGGGGGTFTGNFELFKNASNTKYQVDSTGAVTLAGTSITATNLATLTTAASLSMGSTTTLTLGGNSTINGGTGSGGTLTLVSTTNGSKGNIQFFGSTNSIDSNGNLTIAGDITVNGNDIFANSVGAAATVFNTNATSVSVGGAATTLNFQGGSGATLNIGNSNGATAVNVTSGTGAQTYTSSSTGSNLAGSFVYKNAGITNGDLIYATASGTLGSGTLLKLGTGGNSTFTGNAIFADLDNTGQGGLGFTGNFLRFDNANANKLTVDSTGNIVAAGYVRGKNLVIGGSGGLAGCADNADGICGSANLWLTTGGNIYLMPNWNGAGSGQSAQMFIGSTNATGKGFVAIDGQYGGNPALSVKTAGAGPDIFTASSSAGLTRFVVQNAGNVGIGTAAPSSLLHLADSNTTAGNEFFATASAMTNGSIIKLGQGGNTNFTGNGLWMDFDNTGQGGIGFTGNFLKFDNATVTKFTVGSTGNVNAGGLTGVAYNAFANVGDTPQATSAITTNNDLFIGGDTEIKGSLYLTGKQIFSFNSGTPVAAITFPTDPTALDSKNFLTDGSWLVQNSINDGIAALMVNQTKGGDIFSASASGGTKFTISNSGQVAIGSAAPTKTLDVTGDIRLTGKLYDTNVTGGIGLGDSTSTALAGFGASSLVGALNELKNTNKNTSHNDYLDWADHYQAKAEGSNVNTNETLNGLFFDTFADSTKLDAVNSTSSGAIQVSDPAAPNVKPAAPFRVGLTGGQTYNTATNDNAGNAYLGSNTVNKVFYYDRSKDSSPQVQVELGIDPNWYNGVTLSVATTSAQMSQNDTITKPNPNLSTTYNGSLLKVTGTNASPKTIYITIKSPTTFDWTNYNGEAATGVTMTPGTAQTLGGTGASVTFTNTNYNTGDVFKIASWFIEASGSTRGAKQAFPERSYVVAESNTVDVIDADTQKLWMRFSQGTGQAIGTTTNNTPNSVNALNGKIYSADNGSAGALYTLDFTRDTSFQQNATDYRVFSNNATNPTGIASRNSNIGYAVINTSNILVNTVVNDVSAAVIPNQPTQTVTVSGWGYINVSLGAGGGALSETVNLPYKFNNAPLVNITYSGYSVPAPTSPTSCANGTNSVTRYEADAINNSSFTAYFETNTSYSAYSCYTWTATGTVSPKQFVAVATGAANTDGGTTVINETDGTKASLDQGSQNVSYTIRSTKVALLPNGNLYFARTNESLHHTQVLAYNNVPSLTSESSLDQYLDSNYAVGFVDNTSPIISGTDGDNKINSLTATQGTSSIDGQSNTLYVGTDIGVSVIQEKQSHANFGDGTDEYNSSVKYYTKDYISEEMVGDIRGMWPLSANGALSMSDASIKAKTLTNNGTATAVSGVRGAGVSLNGSTQYLSRASDADLDAYPISFGAWFKTSSATNQAIINKYVSASGNGYNLDLTAGGQVEFYYYKAAGNYVSPGASGPNYADGKWHHVVVTVDSTGGNAYVDGQQIQSATWVGTAGATTTTQQLEIGRYNASGMYFNGSLDEPFITGTVLTAGQVKHMYEVGYRALQGHATTLGGGAADTNQQLGFISTGTNTVGDARPDYNNQYMYVGLNSTTLGGLSKIDLNSDTNVKTYNSSANVPTGGTLLVDEDVNSVAVGYQLEAVGSAASGVKSMAPDNNSNALTGSLFSKTQTLASSTKFAYLWTSFVTDASDASNGINVYACNSQATKALCDSNNAWVLGTWIQTDSNQTPPEREYSFSFSTAGSNLTFKIDFARGSTKTNTYLARYGATWASSVGGADIAERYKSTEPVYPGDILSITSPVSNGEASVALARLPNDPKLIGIVTTNPGIVMDNNLVDLNFNAASRNSPDRPAVALAGRVPVKVSTVNGPISVGDPITSSTEGGVGVRATKAGTTIGKALQAFDCPNKDTSGVGLDSPEVGTPSATPVKQVCEGSTMVLVNVSWYDPDVYLTNIGNIQFSKDLADAQHAVYKIVRVTIDGTNEVVDRIGTFGQLIAGNIKAGAIETQDFVTQNLVAKVIKTNMISPLPDSTDVIVQIGSEATPSGKFAIQNSQGNEVAAVDSGGNARLQGDLSARQATFSGQVTSDKLQVTSGATISGTLYADNIKSKSLDDIKALLTQVQTDQSVLLAATSGANLTASTSASLANLITSDLYITNQAAINSLSVTNNLAVGTDFVISQTLGTSELSTSLNTLSGPLKLQSLALAPVEIMDGLVKIDTHGNVQIAGNLAVRGNIDVAGHIRTTGLIIQPHSTSGVEQLQNSAAVARIDASGSATLSSVTTPQFVVAAPDATTAGTIVNGVITTNSTIGKAVIPAGRSEITIQNPKVTDYTLVYVTPTSPTDNYVLYVKNKQAGQFIVGFSSPLNIDVGFNWWIVQVTQ